jgi:quinol---cytochrome-c reductase cytochrome b subunit
VPACQPVVVVVKRRRFDPAALPRQTGRAVDARLRVATPLRGILNRVFPDHWSLLLGEIALYSFVVLLVTGTFLTFFFDPSMEDVVYDGSYAPLRGTHMSAAYASTLDISFDVRGGLLMRQIHHWAALLFIASIVVYLLRVFFTGAFRKPRELKWIIGLLLFWVAILTGYTGYMAMDDGLSGTGLRILSGILLSIPVVGTWLASSIFGGEFPGDVIIGRLYILHVLLLPGLLVALMSIQIGLRLWQKPSQWPGPGRTNANVVGERVFPRYAMKQAGLFMLVCAVIALLGGLLQVNPVWLFGPSHPANAAAASQPAWYLLFLDGAVRLMPPWEVTIPIGDGYAIPPTFWAAVVLPGILFALPMVYPFIERRVRRDNREHHLLERPRDAPTRTALGAMAVTFYLVLTISGGSDVIAHTFHVSTNAMMWAGRIGLLLLPPAAYWVTHRICLGLQQHDREVLAHGVETGIIRRLPDGGFTEVHQPLAIPDRNGHAELPYAGWAVPKKINHLGALSPAAKGFFKPIEQAAQSTGSGDGRRIGR